MNVLVKPQSAGATYSSCPKVYVCCYSAPGSNVVNT